MSKTRDLCVYLVEAGGPQESGISDETISLVRKCIQDKIFAEKQDAVCIARADMTKNYKFGTVDWESFKDTEEVFKKKKAKGENPISSLLTVCESMSLQATEDVYELKKVMFLCDLRTHTLKEDEIKKLKKRYEDENISLSVIVSDVEPRNDTQEINVKMLRKILVGHNFEISTFKKAFIQVANTLSEKAPRPSPWSVAMEIGGDIKINVSGFVSIRANTSTKKIELTKAYLKDSKSGEVESAKVVTETTTTWKENDGTDVDEEMLGTAYYYGDKLVPYNELEKEDEYCSGGKCLKVLVFCPKELIMPCYLLGNGVTLFYPRDKDINAALAFNALLSAMNKAGRVAIVRKVYRENTKAVLGMLLPNMEKKCLTFAELCFSEDISIPSFPLLVKNMSLEDDGLVEKDQLMDEFIMSKSLSSFTPSEGPADPSVQQYRDTIANKILGRLARDEANSSSGDLQPDNVDLYFMDLVKKEVPVDTMKKLVSAFPLKVNVIEEERASGVNIFKKRAIKAEENGSPAKKPKVEVAEVEVKMEDDDNGGLNADDLLDEL